MAQSQQYLYETRISDHLALTKEGYLLCTRCVLARSGPQQYLKRELFPDSNSDEIVTVNRPVEEVTDAQFLASFPGRAYTVRHPSSGMVNADTHGWSARGTVLRAYVGDELDDDGNTLILGDIVIHEPTAIQRVLAGERQLSVGYRYELEQGADGGLEMRNLIANHVAGVEQGRAQVAMIVDSAIRDDDVAHRIDQLSAGTADDDEIPESEDEDMIKKTTDQDELRAQMGRLCALLEKLLSSKGANDDALLPAPTLSASERGTNPVVDDLRRLRPAIQASGDRAAIDAFNTAMTLAKRGVAAPAESLLSAYDRQPSGALSFEELVRLRGDDLTSGRLLPSQPTDYSAAAAERHALDQKAERLSYGEMIKRAGERMCRDPHPRG